MSNFSIDRAVFAFLANCCGVFTQWPQCSIIALQGNNEGGRLSGVLFKAMAMNPVDRTVFRIVITKDDYWRVRIVQVSNKIRLDGVNADQDLIVHAVNRFMELAGMVERQES
jgi:hypothetical protein|nr:MAG TPA: hypothetical protein [Caudoviricetes sp.]